MHGIPNCIKLDSCWWKNSNCRLMRAQRKITAIFFSAQEKEKVFAFRQGYRDEVCVSSQKHLHVIGKISVLVKLVCISLPMVEKHVPSYFLTNTPSPSPDACNFGWAASAVRHLQ